MTGRLSFVVKIPSNERFLDVDVCVYDFGILLGSTWSMTLEVIPDP